MPKPDKHDRPMHRPPATPPPTADAAPAADSEAGLTGRLASEIDIRQVEWLWYPWIPLGFFGLLVGDPSAGKSTLLASLLAYVTGGMPLGDDYFPTWGRAILLPGHEEAVDTLCIPRLKACGVQADRVRVLEGPGIALLADKKRLAREVRAFGACLLVGDPIDSYVDDGFSEDKGQQVRPLLEAAAWIAAQTGAAVLFARHPGKDPGNVCPGSRQWRAVPKVILQVSREEGCPPKGLLSLFKDGLGTGADPVRYTLEGESGRPKRLAIKGGMGPSAQEVMRAAGGLTGRYKLMAACRLIVWTFQQKEEPTRHQLGEDARRLGIGEDTLNDALRVLEVRSVPPSERGLPWSLVRLAKEWPTWLQVEGGPELSGDVPTCPDP